MKKNTIGNRFLSPPVLLILIIPVLLINCFPVSPKGLLSDDPAVREKSAKAIIKASEKNIKFLDEDLPGIVNALKDENKNVRLAALKVLKIAQNETFIPEIGKLFMDAEEEVREKASEAILILPEQAIAYLNSVLFEKKLEKEKASYSDEQMENLKKYSVITYIKLDKFDSILNGDDKVLIGYGEKYYAQKNDLDKLRVIADYYFNKKNYTKASELYISIGDEATTVYEKAADDSFNNKDYETALVYYEKAGNKEKAAAAKKLILKPTPGLWKGANITFYVSKDGKSIIPNSAMEDGCSIMPTTHGYGFTTLSYVRAVIPIKKDGTFYYSNDSITISGKFISSTYAKGTASSHSGYYGMYGYVSQSASSTWEAKP